MEFLGWMLLAYVTYAIARAIYDNSDGGRAASGKDSGQDNFEGWFVGGDDPRSVSANLEIGYRDAKGNRTKRRVHVRQFDPGLSGGMLLAHCHLRDESRSFRADRIASCVDLDTGEMVKDVIGYLSQRHEKDPRRAVEWLARDYRDIVRVLGFIALADGDFSEQEKRIVADYLRRLTKDDRVTPEIVAMAARDMGKRSLHGFKMALGRVINSGGVSPVLLAGCCRSIAEVDGVITPGEQEVLDYLDKRILSGPPS